MNFGELKIIIRGFSLTSHRRVRDYSRSDLLRSNDAGSKDANSHYLAIFLLRWLAPLILNWRIVPQV
jgi:hypothetical protein